MMNITVLETCRGIKRTSYKIRICALSWLITKITKITKASIDSLWQTIVPHHSDWLKSRDWYETFKILSTKTCWWFVLYCKWYLMWPSVRTGLVPALFRWEMTGSLTPLLSYGLHAYHKLFRAWYKGSSCLFLENLGVIRCCFCHIPWIQLS